MRQVRMTMIPSIGYFLVVPKLGLKWQNFKNEALKKMEGKQIDEQTMLETILPEVLEVFDWKFCFVNETEMFFQSNSTIEFEQKYGDLQLKIREQEFYLLSVIEKDLLSKHNLAELQKLD